MYIALYDEELSHVANLNHATNERTIRVYDLDSFSGVGACDDDVTDAKIAVLCDDEGNYIYACFTDGITPDGLQKTVKGLDFKTLWDTEVLFDFTDGSFDPSLGMIFNRVKELVFDTPDVAALKIPVEVIIPADLEDTSTLFPDYNNTYFFKNAYAFLKPYLKNYEYNIESYFDISAGKIVFTFVKCNQSVDVDLSDFIHELTTTSTATNKAVATVKYTIEYDEHGEPTNLPRQGVAMTHYYRTSENEIVISDEYGNIPDRIYPVKAKIFESEYLSDAQFNAVYELADSRYVDNIIIDNSKTRDPIDFSPYPLYTKVSLYYEGRLYKVLPISEKIYSQSGGGESLKIKLGFKKILLTEIIKGK